MILTPDVSRVGSTCPQDIPGVGLLPNTLDALGLTEDEAGALIAAGLPAILVADTPATETAHDAETPAETDEA